MLLGVLVSAGTATTNPNPNTLTTISPFSSGTFSRTISAAWKTQAKPALFFQGNLSETRNYKVPIAFVPSVSTASYTATMWKFVRKANVWVVPKDYSSFSFTGAVSTYIENPDEDAVFIQLSGISSGNVAVYYDDSLMAAL